VQRVFFSDVNAATVRVLAAEGCEVVTPKLQGCCGALSVHAGREEEFEGFARKLIDTFEGWSSTTSSSTPPAAARRSRSTATSCATTPSTPSGRAQFAEKVKDVTEFIQELGPVAERHPLPVAAAYHDACHLAHAQGVRKQPRQTLKQIPGMEVREIKEAEICCGSPASTTWSSPSPPPSSATARRRTS
jgi:glycolate oxidase iron-sulfur subunit